MSVHGRDELARENRRIIATTRGSLMSDTKWRKLLSALFDAKLELQQCIVKFVGDVDEKIIGVPSGLYPPRPWIDTIEFGPIPLRAIEWMLFPRVAEYAGPDRTIPKRRVEQAVDEAARIASSLGRYPIALDERGLLITGHLAA